MQLGTASSQKWAPSVASMGSNRARWPVSRLSLWYQPVAAPEEDFLTSHYFKTHFNCNVCNLTAAGLLLGCFPCESQFAVVFNIKIFSVKLTGVTCDCKRELNCFSSLLCIRRIIYCNLLKTENKTGSLCGSGRWSRSVVGICFRREQDSAVGLPRDSLRVVCRIYPWVHITNYYHTETTEFPPWISIPAFFPVGMWGLSSSLTGH